MGKINILEQNVFNMISAGEVVERPSSVVKELVENSIDAGATQIDIYVEEGGTRRIQVSDNGIGILPEDMRSAFLPHATSKLQKITDLDTLSTLGFRGEALASIASVSEVSLTSASGDTCSKIMLSGGKVVFEGQDSRAKGTIINVDNLFFNTPARLKFLKKASSELHYIQDTVKMLVLANPNVHITLSNEDGTILENEGGELIDAVYSVYGAKIADNLLEIEGSDGYIKVRGYTSKIDFVKPNRTYQSIIVNGRAVEDATIQTAVEKAYSQYLMKRTYPVFMIDILMPFEDVDVNVHPSKTEVRFRDRQAVFGAVYHAVENTLNASVSSGKIGFNILNSVGAESPNENAERKFVQTAIDTSKLYGKTAPKSFSPSKFDVSATINPFVGTQNMLHDGEIGLYSPSVYPTINEFESKNTNLDAQNVLEALPYSSDLHVDVLQDGEECRVFDGKIVGQIFSTYIICERNDFAYIIDQHAAHERLLYDRILEKFNVEFKQSLLIPYKLSLTGEEDEFFEKILGNLKNLGFDISENGSCNYLITAVPEPVSSVDFSKFFSNLFANMLDDNSLSLENLLKDRLCQQACKAAIKGGETLTRAQIERVIENYVDENGDLPTKCPHGRPAVVAVSRRDVEKLFKRIV